MLVPIFLIKFKYACVTNSGYKTQKTMTCVSHVLDSGRRTQHYDHELQ